MKKYINIIIVLVFFIALSIYTSPSVVEIIASLTGLMCVWLSAKESIHSYSTGFINAGLYAYMFYQAKLYADATLQIVFIVLMLFGLYIWLTKREGNVVRPTRSMHVVERYLTLPVIALVTTLWGLFLHHFTDASIPYLDAFIASTSIVAQYFLSKKVLQNWLLWIFIDVLSVGMYIYKDLYMVAFTYTIFLIIAIFGWISWKKEYDAQ